MTAYILHRVYTLLAFSGLLFFIGYQAEGIDAWWLLLAVVSVFGYAHYVIGGYYQMRQLRKDAHRRVLAFTTLVMIILSVLVMVAFVAADLFYILSFLVILYFLWHGYENEITLFERQTGIHARRDTIGALVLMTLALALFGVGHASWYFTPWYEFVATTPIIYDALPGGVLLPLLAFWLGVLALIGSLLLALHAVVRGSNVWFNGFFLIALLFVAVIGIVYVPLHYVVVLGGLLFYHFMVWFLFYEERFRIRGATDWLPYITMHVAIATVFLLAWFFQQNTFLTYTLNSYVFLTATLIHITLSFLNETWVRQLLIR